MGQATAAGVEVAVPQNPIFDYYLKLESVLGDSERRGFEGQIVVTSWNWGITNSGIARPGHTGKTTALDFVFTALTSIASPPMALAVATRQPVKHAVVSTVNAEGNVPFKLRFDKVMLTGYRQATGETDGHPIDLVSLVYGKATYTVTPQNDDGSEGDPVVVVFDWATGMKR